MAEIKKTVTSVGEDMEKLEALQVASEIVKWHSHFKKQFGSFSKS